MAAADDHGSEIDDELRDHISDRIDHRHHPDHDPRPRAHSVLPPPARRTSYDQRSAQPDPHRDRRQSTSVIPQQSWGSPPQQPPPAPYYTQDAFGAHAYIEPRAPSHRQMPPPPAHPQWGYQLPPPQGYPSSSHASRSPGPSYPDPRTQQYRPPPPPAGYYPGPPGYGPPGPPYGPGPGGATVDPNIFKPDPYGRPGMQDGPPDAARPDVQITYTDDSATKLTQYLRRRCFNCRVTEPPGWRKSTLNPGKIVCNKCGLYERSHARPRPLHMDNPKGPAQ